MEGGWRTYGDICVQLNKVITYKPSQINSLSEIVEVTTLREQRDWMVVWNTSGRGAPSLESEVLMLMIFGPIY